MNFSLSWRSIYGVAVTAFALTVSFAAGPSQAQMGPNAQGAARPANSILVFLKRSDVLLSPRFYRKEWRKAFEDFSATKIVWTYGAERFFPDNGLGNIPMQCTLPFWTRAKEPEHEKLVCRTRNGEPVGMQFAGSPVRQYYPDVLAPEWLERQIAAGKSLADRGCRHFMQDDPPLNVSRISQGGCFSQAMSERYERFLKGNNLADSRQSLESFQKEVVLNYHRALHAAIRKHVQAISPQTPVTFAGNVTNRQAQRAQWVTGQFDFLISELYAGRENLLSAMQTLRTQSAPLPGVSALTYASTDVALNRVAIAGAYALGMVPVAPWDVYLDAQKGRFFGNPAD